MKILIILTAVALASAACGDYECSDDPPAAYEHVPATECWEDSDGTICCSYEFGRCAAIICSNTCYQDVGGWLCD